MSDYNDDSYSDGNMPKMITTIITVMLAMIVTMAIIIPVVSNTTHEEISNSEPSGIYMSHIDSDTESEMMMISVQLSNNKIAITGDYTKTVIADDQIIVLSNISCLYVKNGTMYYFDGTERTETYNITMVYLDGQLNNVDVDWVYFPTPNGIYSSFTSVEHIFSEKVGIAPFIQPEIVTTWTTYEIDGKDVICNVKTRN